MHSSQPASGRSSVHVLALAGGAGTRFWPLSRRSRPKQLLPDGQGATLLGATLRRVPWVDASNQWVVTGASHAEACRRAVPRVPEGQILVEPQGRNTAAAVALWGVHLKVRDPDAIGVILPADHHVADPEAFNAALQRAVEAARGGAIATLGIRPTSPQTGFGYLEVGGEDPRGGAQVRRFVEKPDHATAQRYLESGAFLWNAGIFVLPMRTLFDELARQMPALNQAMARLERALGTPAYASTLENVYAQLDSISIDHGLMENAKDVVVVAVECGWTDLGTLPALAELGTPDACGNVVVGGEGTILDSSDCLVVCEQGHTVALLGVRDLVVVQTPDATLVLPAARAQDVRQVVEALKQAGRDDLL